MQYIKRKTYQELVAEWGRAWAFKFEFSGSNLAANWNFENILIVIFAFLQINYISKNH